MSDIVQRSGSGPRDRMVLAAVLIVVGIAGLVSQVWDLDAIAGGGIVLLIGLGLLGAFAYTRQYGYLIAGSIMTGLGTGILASEVLTFPSDEAASGAIVLGLGVGFLAIWVLGSILRVPQNHWWPAIPGGIVASVGAALIIGGQATALLDYWAVVPIIIGLVVLWRAFTETRARA